IRHVHSLAPCRIIAAPDIDLSRRFIMPRARWCSVVVLLLPLSANAQALPGTKLLEEKADFARVMVDGIGKYLDRETAASVEKRKAYWKPEYSSPEAYMKSVSPNRERFKKIIGVVDAGLPAAMEHVATTEQPALVAETEGYKVYTVRWPVLEGVYGEGLLLQPTGNVIANVIALPDADATPEWFAGIDRGHSVGMLADNLVRRGCRVLVPTLVNRDDKYSGSARVNRWTNQPHREFIYRMAYQM